MRARLRAVLLALIAVLYALSIPWYRAPGRAPSQVFGMPDWVAVAVACYAAIAVLNAAAWLLADIPEPPAGDGDGGA